MTAHRAEQHALELLGAAGPVDPPSTAVLRAARESLWSLVIGEMRSDDLSRRAAREHRVLPASTQQPAPRRKPDQASQHRQARE